MLKIDWKQAIIILPPFCSIILSIFLWSHYRYRYRYFSKTSFRYRYFSETSYRYWYFSELPNQYRYFSEMSYRYFSELLCRYWYRYRLFSGLSYRYQYFQNDHVDIDIDIFQKWRYIDNQYSISIYRTGLMQCHFEPFWWLWAILGHFGAVLGHFGAPVGTEMAPGWSNMTYIHVIYPWEVF